MTKPGWKSTEFYLTIIAFAISAAWGLVKDGTTADHAFAFAAMALSSLGYSVSRGIVKARASAGTPISGQLLETIVAPVDVKRDTQAGFTRWGVMFALWLGFAAIGATVIGCTWLHEAKTDGAQAWKDCKSSAAKSLIDQFSPVVEGYIMSRIDSSGKIDQPSVETAASNVIINTGGCVFADAFAHLLSPQPTGSGAPRSSPMAIDTDQVRAVFESVRAKKLGGAHFDTQWGPL